MSRAVTGAPALRTIDEGYIVPEIAIGNTVLELCVLASDQLISFADFQRGAAAIASVAEGLGVLGASRNVNRV